MKKMGQWIQRVVSVAKKDEGQGMVEYGLILVLIAVVVVAALTPMGQAVKTVFDNITSSL